MSKTGEMLLGGGVKVQNKYVVSDMYHTLREEQDIEEDVWNKLWKWNGPKRVQVFMWIAMHDRLLTSERRSRILGGSPYCYRCAGIQESLMHVLRDCEFARSLWLELKRGHLEPDFLILQGVDGFKWNLEKPDETWKLVFGVACWMLWTWRNKSLFDEQFVVPMNRGRAVWWYVQEVKTAKRELGVITGVKQEVNISWSPPSEGWWKLNVDGASKGLDKVAGCGGLIRDESGRWITGFTRKLGTCSAIKAELWAALTGLKLATMKNLQNVMVECDSSAAVRLLNQLKSDGITDAGSVLIANIGREMAKIPRLIISHVYREGNICADALANIACVQDDLFTVLDNPPAMMGDLLIRDVIGAAQPRLILI